MLHRRSALFGCPVSLNHFAMPSACSYCDRAINLYSLSTPSISSCLALPQDCTVWLLRQCVANVWMGHQSVLSSHIVWLCSQFIHSGRAVTLYHLPWSSGCNVCPCFRAWTLVSTVWLFHWFVPSAPVIGLNRFCCPYGLYCLPVPSTPSGQPILQGRFSATKVEFPVTIAGYSPTPFPPHLFIGWAFITEPVKCISK